MVWFLEIEAIHVLGMTEASNSFHVEQDLLIWTPGDKCSNMLMQIYLKQNQKETETMYIDLEPVFGV